MKSIVSRFFLLPVLSAAIVLCIASRAYGQSGCLSFANTQTIVYYQLEGPEIDTTIEITNNTDSTITFNGVTDLVSGDADIFHFPSLGYGRGVTLLPGQSWSLEMEIYLQCPPTKAVYTGIIAMLSGNGTPCSFDTFTVYIQFPITDTITLQYSTNISTINIAPSMARSGHVLRLVNTGLRTIFLDSIYLEHASNIAYFGQPGNDTFVFNDSLLAGQSNDSAVMTIVPSDTGIQDIDIALYSSLGIGRDIVRDSVTQNSLNEYPLTVRVPSFYNLVPDQKKDSIFYIVNTTPDTLHITELNITGDYEPNVPWSIDTGNGSFPVRLPFILSPIQHIPITIGALDSGCDPITGTLEVIYSYGCGTDTAIFPLNGRIGQGTVCNPFACISTDSSLDFGAVAAGDSVTQSLTLTNQTNDTVEVSLAMVGFESSLFTNPNQIMNPIVIPGYGSVDISIGFIMPSNSPLQNYSAELIGGESSSDGYFVCDTLFIPLTASLLPPAEVPEEATPKLVGFSLIPNPASGDVTILLSQNENATIEIYDVLGRMILSQQAMGQYVWSGGMPSGMAASGVYIVRVMEQEVDGSFNVSSKRLVFQR